MRKSIKLSLDIGMLNTANTHSLFHYLWYKCRQITYWIHAEFWRILKVKTANPWKWIGINVLTQKTKLMFVQRKVSNNDVTCQANSLYCSVTFWEKAQKYHWILECSTQITDIRYFIIFGINVVKSLTEYTPLDVEEFWK